MASELPRVDVADVISGAISKAKEALDKGQAVVHVYAMPRTNLSVRAKKRIIRLDEGKIARLEYALVYVVSKALSENKRPIFKEYAELVGDYKAAAAYLAFLWRNGLVRFTDSNHALNIFIAANSLSQKTYEHKIVKSLNAEFTVDIDKLKSLPGDDIVCVQRDGRVLCRYVVSTTPRAQAKAQVRAIIDLAGYKPA